MGLTLGTRLASYEITGVLGKGGMGEVYRARDSRLKREVAIKILPDGYSRDPERVSRFQREAEVLASLNHPNIAAIHSLENENGVRFLVLELVEGETLAERLSHGPIPIDEALNIAQGICEALQGAHENGVVHRDLKPANIKVTSEGKIKVLDFGLAKAVENETANPTVSNSPTISIAATKAGLILGTAAYMSPEQAKGLTVDSRSDVFSFGCVFYELLTGRQAFQGETVADILASVLAREPDLNTLPPNLTPRIHGLLRRCFEKNPKRRWQAVGDLGIELETVAASPTMGLEDRVMRLSGSSRLAWSFVGLLSIVVISGLLMWPRAKPATTAAALRLTSDLGTDAALANVGNRDVLAISPDGSALAFVAIEKNVLQIYLRRLGQLQATPLAGTEGAAHPFFSPQGNWIGFFAGGMLKKISLTGGAAVDICVAPNARGGSWGDDNKIVFNPINFGPGSILQRVSADEGTPETLTHFGPGEVTHRWPQVLPGSKLVLYTANSNTNVFDDANIMALTVATGKTEIVQRGGYHARYVSSGHLVYIHDGDLFAVPFDLDRVKVTGPPVLVVPGIESAIGTGNAQFAISDDGRLVYVPRQRKSDNASTLWMTRDGKTMPLRATPSIWSDPRFSPDGRRLAFDITDGRQNDVYVYDWERDLMSRLTSDPANDMYPVWTPDSARIAFSSSRDKGVSHMYWQRSDGTGEVHPLIASQNQQVPTSFHPSGRYLAFDEVTPNGLDIMIMPLDGDEKSGWKLGKPTSFADGRASEQDATFSPDGQWVAYESDESGQPEIFVRPFPGPGGQWPISTAGGTGAMWSRTQEQLFYLAPDNRLMVVSYKIEGTSFKAQKPQVWSQQAVVRRPRRRSIDLYPESEKFAVAIAEATPFDGKPDQVVLVLDFVNELRRVAPASVR